MYIPDRIKGKATEFLALHAREIWIGAMPEVL